MNFNLKDSIVYEDDNLLIVNKPRGLLLQQDGDNNHESLDKIVSDYLKMVAMPAHRLDKDTSGLCVFAKNKKTADELGKIFNDHITQNKDGEMYLDGDALFGIFYFDNDYFVDVPEEKDETNAIERAIISNICPSEAKRLKWNSLSLRHYFYPTSQSKSLAGLHFHHYVAKYENFRVEFAFTPTEKGICVVMFIYNHDGTKADAAISVMESLRIK